MHKSNHDIEYDRLVPIIWHCIGIFIAAQSYIARNIASLMFFKTQKSNDFHNIEINEIKSILIVRMDGLGDLMLSIGFLSSLRKLFQDAKITLVVKKEFAMLIGNCNYIDNVIGFDTSCPRMLKPFVLPIRSMIFARKILAPLKFNLAINPRWDKDEYYASFISFFAETKWNLAYSEKVNNKKKYYNNGFDSFLTACIKNSAKIHEYEKNMNIVCFLGGNPIMDGAAFNFTLKDRMFADTILKAEEKGVKSMLIALAPGARHDRRRWPIDRYIKLGIWLCDSFNARLLVLGDKNEKWLGDAIVHSTKESTMDLIGQTTLSQACALLKQCNLFIGNDSGLLHLAASQDIPVIEISCHPINGNLLDRQSPARFGPWTSRKIILQPDVPKYPCVESCDAPNSHCIENVSIEDVQRAILSFLNKEHQLEYEN